MMTSDDIKRLAELCAFYERFNAFKQKIPDEVDGMTITLSGSSKGFRRKSTASIRVSTLLDLQDPFEFVKAIETSMLNQLNEAKIEISSN